MTTTYHSAIYGTGEIISRCNGEIVVRFDFPPGMKHVTGPQVVPIIHYQESKNGK
jgi:hypothetical protein